MKQKNKTFELNLLPVISLLSVCISFLLLTAVWDEVKSVSMSQAVGSESDNKVSTTLSVFIERSGQVKLRVDYKNNKQSNLVVAGQGTKLSWTRLESDIKKIKQANPDLIIALIHPSSNTAYEDVIKMIDVFKAQNISDVGVSPL